MTVWLCTIEPLIKYLLQHPTFKIESLFSTSLTGQLSDYLPEYSTVDLPDVDVFSVDLCKNLDLLFLAVPHTKSMAIVQSVTAAYPNIKIVDLSADFRLTDPQVYESYYAVQHSSADILPNFVYGLPEIYKDELSSTNLCANPGCYATSIILGMLPLKGVTNSDTPIVIDAKSGVSGAGKSLKESSLFCEVNEQLSAYATGQHRHVAEFVQEVGFNQVMFSPHLVPMDRGIESAIYIYNESMSDAKLFSIYDDYYQSKPFVQVLSSDVVPATRLVKGTNYCSIIPKKIGSWIVIFSLLDNLVKGASGQAIQNANIMFGLDETMGLI